MSVSRKRLAEALKGVVDPELGINIVDLGLVYALHVEQGVVTLVLTMTTPTCPMSHLITQHAGAVLQRQPGVERVRVEVVHTPPWSPQMMNQAARGQLGLAAAEEPDRREVLVQAPGSGFLQRSFRSLKRLLTRSP